MTRYYRRKRGNKMRKENLMKNLTELLLNSEDHLVDDYLVVFQFFDLLGTGIVIPSEIDEDNPYCKEELKELMDDIPDKVVEFICDMVQIIRDKAKELDIIMDELEGNEKIVIN
jgi:hypothetical protein